MAHFWRVFKLLFLFLMTAARAPTTDTRPARGISSHSDLIAGNEFLKLFLERDELQRELSSSEYRGRSGAGRMDGGQRRELPDADIVDNFADGPEELAATTKTAAASQRLRVRNGNSNKADATSQQVRLVTSGSKIVFLEEYDDNDAVVDAVARKIDLQKERTTTTTSKSQHAQKLQQHYHRKSNHSKSNPNDEVKVVAVSVSSSSKRASSSQERPVIESPTQVNKYAEKSIKNAKHTTTMQQQQKQQQQQRQQKTESHDHFRTTSSTSKPTRATTAATRVTTTMSTLTTSSSTSSTLASTTAADFINRSHKSEFSIEESEPLTMLQHKARSVYSRASPAAAASTMLDEDSDSENSASTNIQNVLAAPQDQTGAAAAYHSSSSSTTRNFTTRSQSRNQTPPPLPLSLHSYDVDTHDSDDSSTDSDAVGIPDTSARPDGGAEDKLLPFQTVIYHDTKQGHGGPQSRSISYSSLSQNVEDLRSWQQSGGILAEAQRNVSESLKPIARPPAHTSEPAKFYSVPAKMYGEPAKFYSEPAKVYSEPAKVYGQPEKFYSEPAKVYGQPSKFYSEPAKVYSQPAKNYGEPAKTYWPHAATTTSATATTTPTTTVKPTSTTTSHAATIRPGSASAYSSSRRPAIVSRIAFGEAQSSTTSAAAPAPPTVPTKFGQRSSSSPANAASSSFHQRAQHYSQANSQPRRVLFNLDKLPYDLLNAPEQSAAHLLEPDFLKSPPASVTYASSTRQRSCLDAALSTSLSTSQHQHQPQPQRQHSSLSDQHSNQNAKGLPNRDLVKCVSKYSPPPAAPTAEGASLRLHFTTERSHTEEEDLYTPTPEQNYEIEESVSVMTNGRAHEVHGGAGLGIGLVTSTPTPTTTKPTRSRNRYSVATTLGGRQYAKSNSNANANVADGQDDNGGGGGGTEDQQHNNNNNNYDDDDDNNNNEDDADDAEEDVSDDGRAKSQGSDDEDDSKVAYVVEGRNYRKYRVEEKTDDGFIVGEYGVVNHNDGNLRGVRYTADSTINRSLIQKALLTFLKLK